jgi:uncharacterized membrane protein YhdT
MTWPDFLVTFVCATLVLLLFCRRLFRGAWVRFGQTVLFVVALCFALDYPAETRAMWTFPRVSGIRLLDTPIENPIFIGTCVVDILIVYQSLSANLRATRGATRDRARSDRR